MKSAKSDKVVLARQITTILDKVESQKQANLEIQMDQLRKPMGMCCEKVSNETGVKWIQALDILCIVIAPRSIMALAALFSQAHWVIYIRIRNLTFFAFWPIALLAVVSYTMTNFFLAEEFDRDKIAALCVSVVAIILGFFIDFHFRKVMNYYGTYKLQKIIESEK